MCERLCSHGCVAGSAEDEIFIRTADVNVKSEQTSCVPSMQVAGADQSSIDAIKAVGGSVTIVYMACASEWVARSGCAHRFQSVAE